ncbi:MAG TPA: response regulator [Thermoanaerobaculia bacterium]|nr:response regulator [Thermoanaerobaculia bacterium]
MISAISKIRRQHCRVLVVDDEDEFRRAFVFRLRHQYHADVDDAEEALAALTKVSDGDAFDLILMDVSMPGIDGFEACKAMRARGVGIRIVLMSAHEENRAKAKGLGLQFLDKPLNDRSLEEILLACGGGSTS